MSDLLMDMDPASPTYNDLKIVNGDLSLADGDAAIRQRLLLSLQLFLGEWFLDTTKGVPYYQFILVKNPNLDLVEATIKNVILSCPGIVELTDFEFGYNNGLRTLSVNFDAKSTNGTIISVAVGV